VGRRFHVPVVFAGWAALAACAWAGEGAPEPDAARAKKIVHMVRQDCGSCHGLTMKGGLGPSLEPAALADKDPEQLRQVLLRGRPGTAMPPWERFLTEAEAAWVIELLRKGLPRE
jgi:cytochrome c55X